jgi:predicted 3-demethylubiquinone-9 3-methyltransferase (glyoxalase superfamily)
MVRTTPSISTFLWFERNAEAAVEFYTTLFPNSRITKIARWGDGGPAPKGSVMTVAFELAGHKLTALNGGPHYKLTPADGGKPSMCGWLEDRFGLSWQVIPSVIGDLLTDADPAKAARAGRALMSMQKLDLAALQRAHRGELASA